MQEYCSKMMAEINTPTTRIMTPIIKYVVEKDGVICLFTSEGKFVTHISNVLITIGD